MQSLKEKLREKAAAKAVTLCVFAGTDDWRTTTSGWFKLNQDNTQDIKVKGTKQTAKRGNRAAFESVN